jgi:hypothetical protein
MTIPQNVVPVLSGHISPETAYLVEDYPYGFRLRCQMRYWLEFNPTHGVRMISQTSNPKKPGLVWNKPKASVYSRFGGAMYLDSDNHVQWSGLHEYMDHAEVVPWCEKFGAGVPAACVPLMERWQKAVIAYDAKKTAA